MSEHDDILAAQVAEARAGLVIPSPLEERIAILEAAMQEDGARLDALEALFKSLNEQLLRLSLNASVALEGKK